MDDETATGGGHSRRRFLQVAAVGAPVAALAGARAAAPTRTTADFTHRGHHVHVTRDGQRVSLRVDGRVVPGAVQVRGDGVLASPQLLPYSDADWGTDVHELARRLVDGNRVDYVIF